jgi:predicted acetyltransferase
MADRELQIQVSGAHDWDDISRMLRVAFHQGFDEERDGNERAVFEPDRSLLIRDGAEVVAHAAAYTRELSVPGAVVPAAHVTQVGVAATHRRRGLLTRMMHRQLREVREAGREPVAVLWASEGRIYPRFGYGHAAQRLRFDADLREVHLPGSGTGRLRVGDPNTLRPELQRVYERLRPYRPGWSSRDEQWWRYVLADPVSQRNGAVELRALLHEGADGVDGYALFRSQSRWDKAGPCCVVEVSEFAATNPEAYGALWRFLFTIDLARTTSYGFAATDEPLQHLVGEPRRLGTQLLDALWLRIVDVEAALATRRYAAPVDVVFEITDPLLTENAGRWRLTGDADGARCARTGAAADLACDVRDLAAAYLGGPSLGALAAAGRVRELRPGAVTRADAAFGWHRAPVGIEVF